MDTSTDYFLPKKKKRAIWLWVFNGISLACLALGVTAAVAYVSIPSIDNINDCFTTSMFQVELCPKNKSYVRYNQLPKHLVSSLIASEDASFFFHNGFDWDEIQDSLEKSMDAGRWVRGGSTLTQQLAKNLYLSKEKSLTRKLKEFFISQQIEKKLTKAQIIEKYFNVVEFGKNIYGIQKAASHYFKKSPSALSPAEGAYLISLLPSPVRYSATYESKHDLSGFNKKRVVRILSLLKLQNKITESEYEYERGRTLAGLWSDFSPTEESGIFWVNGEKKTSESTDGARETEDSPDAIQNDNEAPAAEEDFE
jgi:monofunctional biosynthetic peptidoglycan transglycosylase